MSDKKIVNEHIQEETFTQVEFYPSHEERVESEMFRKTKKRLKEDGHYHCLICGKTENIESHHFLEKAFEQDCDFDKLKEFLMKYDIYGYSNSDEFKDKPIENLDDIRNQILLCDIHHRHKLCSIHHVSFPDFIAQALCKMNPIPQNDDDIIKEEQKLGIKLGTYDDKFKKNNKFERGCL